MKENNMRYFFLLLNGLIKSFRYETLGGINFNIKSIQFMARHSNDKTKFKFILMEIRENQHFNFIIISEIKKEIEAMYSFLL